MTTQIRKIQVRRDTSANWASANPVLSSGEIGWDTTLQKGKVGDGTSTWSALSFKMGMSLTDLNAAEALPSQDPRQLQADVLLGAGNLHEWFIRQFNVNTGSTVEGANKRVSIAYCGDSLSERCAGFIGYFASKSFSNLDGFGIYGAGQILSTPASFQVPAGPFPGTTGDVTAVTNGHSIWMSGLYWDVGPSGTIKWDNAFPTLCSVAKVYYVAESGAGTFVIETSPDGTTWTQQGAAVNASNATQIGAVATRTFTQARCYVRVRNTHGSARVKIIGPYLGQPTSVSGFEGSAISQGGISITSFCTTPSAIYTPILTDLNPALITFHFDDPLSEYSTNWSALMAIAKAGNANRSVLIIANGPRQSDGDSSMTSVMKFLRTKIDVDNIAVFDLFSSVGPWSRASTAGWTGDGIHLNPQAYAYGAAVAWKSLDLSTFFDKSSANVRNDLTETQRLALGQSWVAYTGVAGDYLLEFVPDTSFGTGTTLKVRTDDVWFFGDNGNKSYVGLEIVNSELTASGTASIKAGTAATGSVRLIPGPSTRLGFIEWYNQATRFAYLGFDLAVADTLTLTLEEAKSFIVLGGTITTEGIVATNWPTSDPSGGELWLNGPFVMCGASSVSATEIGYLDGVLAPIQPQINSRAPLDPRLRKTWDKLYTIGTGSAAQLKVLIWSDSMNGLGGGSTNELFCNALRNAYGDAGASFPSDPTAAGSATGWVAGTYTRWPTGTPPATTGLNGTLTWNRSGGLAYCDAIKIYYIRESGAGSFKVQTSVDGSTWVDEVGYTSVSASNGSMALGTISLTKTLGFYAVRVVGISGTVYFPAVRLYTTSVSSVEVLSIATGGLGLPDANTAPAVIWGGVVQDFAPDLGIWEMKESAASLATSLPAWWTNITTYTPTSDWIFYGSTPLQSGDADQVAQNAIIKTHCDTYSKFYFDAYQLFGGSWTVANAYGWMDDGTHRSAKGNGYLATEKVKATGIFEGHVAKNTNGVRTLSEIASATSIALTIPGEIRTGQTDLVKMRVRSGTANQDAEMLLNRSIVFAATTGDPVLINPSSAGGAATVGLPGSVAIGHPSADLFLRRSAASVMHLSTTVGGSSDCGTVWAYVWASHLGTAGSPSYTFQHNQNRGFYPITNGIGVSVGSTNVGSWLSTGYTSAGDLICSTVGKGLQLKSGTGARAGNATLVGGTVTVTNTTVTANTVIYLTRKTAGGTLGNLTYTLSAGASFTINSDSASDTSVISYVLIEVNP